MMQHPALKYKVGAGVLALAGALTPVSRPAAAGESAPAGSATPAEHTVAPIGRPTIVVESYVGQRPPNASAVTW